MTFYRAETELDLQNEIKIMQRLATIYGGAKFSKLDAFAVADYEFIDTKRGKKAFFEIKCRTIPHDRYSTYLIHRSKFDALLRETEKTGVEHFLIFGWSDGVISMIKVTHELRNELLKTSSWKQRTDRTLSSDKGEKFMIPMEKCYHFKQYRRS